MKVIKSRLKKWSDNILIVRSAEGLSQPEPDTEIIRAFKAANSEGEVKG